MSGNSFGSYFRITSFGESHGRGVGVVIDGCPPGLELSEQDIQLELDRRRPGANDLCTPRLEQDQVQILSGVFTGKTTGTPIAMLVLNKDARSEDYTELSNLFRPSHADFSYEAKYGHRDWRGGGRASARETLARVAAGAVARKWLALHYNIELLAFVESVGKLKCDLVAREVCRKHVDSNAVRCPDPIIAQEMTELIQELQQKGDTIGGVIRGQIRGVPAGWGEPVFDKLPAVLGHAMLSIPAAKGFELGSGFAGTLTTGSQHNDSFVREGEVIAPASNRAGGTLGGISSGADIDFRVAFKPVSTIQLEQETVDRDGKKVSYTGGGRHDPCVLPRAVPIVEAMAAIVILDQCLAQRARAGSS